MATAAYPWQRPIKKNKRPFEVMEDAFPAAIGGTSYENQGSPKGCEEVLGTTELLELILLQLPVERVLLAQRVNNEWKSVVEGSSKLQQALFFQPVRKAAVDVAPDEHLQAYNDNLWHFEHRRQPIFAAYPWYCHTALGLLAAAEHTARPCINLLLVKLFRDDIYTAAVAVTVLGLEAPSKIVPRAEAVDPSWTNMFLTQPPCTKALFSVHAENDIRRYAKHFSWPVSGSLIRVDGRHSLLLENQRGIMIGDVVKGLRPILETSSVDFAWLT